MKTVYVITVINIETATIMYQVAFKTIKLVNKQAKIFRTEYDPATYDVLVNRLKALGA